MIHEVCHWGLCFVPLHTTHADKVFEFSDFLTAVALLAIVYTISDARYKFRIAIAPGNLYTVTYALLAMVGIGSLLTVVWPLEHWWVPRTVGLSLVRLQAIWAGLFLAALLTWMWYAFIRPPVFGRRNARRYFNVLVNYVVRGNDEELKIVASELGRSAAKLVSLAKETSRLRVERPAVSKGKPKARKPDAGYFANQVMLLLGNRKLCRHIVRSSPATAKLLFDEMAKTRKYDLPLGQFCRNLSGEAIRWEESFLYDEAEGYDSGLLGYVKPISRAVYGNFDTIEALARQHISPLDVSYQDRRKWTAPQWNAYCRTVLIALEDALRKDRDDYAWQVFARAIEEIRGASRDIYSLNGVEDSYDTDVYQRLHVVVEFVKHAIELFDEATHVPDPLPGIRHNTFPKGIHDHLAGLIADLCFDAAGVSSPFGTSWMVQHNTVWSLFIWHQSPTWKIVRAKAARLLYDEIADMSTNPNYKGARILGFILNVNGLEPRLKPAASGPGREAYALAKAARAWAKKGYMALRSELPDVAESVLIGTISFDEAGPRLVKTYVRGLRREAPKVYLPLDPAPPPAADAAPAAPASPSPIEL